MTPRHVAASLIRTALDPDPDEARRWLGVELAGDAYRESLGERVRRWLGDLFDTLTGGVDGIGGLGTWAAVVVLVVFLALGVLVLSRLRRTPAVQRPDAAVFAEARLGAREHRARAEAALASADWEEALVESVRALASGLVERGLLPEQADVTVHELTGRAGALFPAYAARLGATGRAFDETRYGDRPADQDRARAAVDLDRALATSAPDGAGGRGPVAAVPR